MPNRPWRRCETCEWTKEKQQYVFDSKGEAQPTGELRFECRNVLSPKFDELVQPLEWCSVWFSAEPETCGMCEWFLPFGDGAVSGACIHSMKQPRNYNSRYGACDYFRREQDDSD